MDLSHDKKNAQFTFTPTEYVLVFSRDDRFGNEKSWSLNYLIDRSYKGKDPDIGMPALYISNEHAEQLKKIGFSWIKFD